MKNAYATVTELTSLPSDFVLRRVHSLTGFFLIFFLLEHFLTNSEGALFFKEDGAGFIRMVNLIHSLPYLPFIEIGALAIPFLIHGILGIKYLLSASLNSFPNLGASPSLTRFSRNHAYTWQRITGALLVFGLLLHVAEMRFRLFPKEVRVAGKEHYILPLTMDKGIYTVSSRLNVLLFDGKAIADMKRELVRLKSDCGPVPKVHNETRYSREDAAQLLRFQDTKEKISWFETITGTSCRENEVLAAADNFGTIVLLSVRNTFKSVPMCIIYSLFVLAAAFHAANGLWTFCITWGITMNEKGRSLMRMASTGLMLLLLFFGFAAIWGIYWINLRE